MIRSILKQMWNERKSNGWLLTELFLAALFLWFITDRFMVDFYTYIQPKGFDVSHTYRVKLGELKEGDRGYAEGDKTTETLTEDLLVMMQRIEQLPGIETVSSSYFSCFYSTGNARRMLVASPEDDEGVYSPEYNYRRVTPEFFELSRILTEDGKAIDPTGFPHNAVVISAEVRDKLFPDKRAIGQYVYNISMSDTVRYVVGAVCAPIRNTEYEKADPCYFECMIGPSLVKNVKTFGPARAELMIRAYPEADKDFANKFITQMGERLTINNLYVSGIEPMENMRDRKLTNYWKEQKTDLSLFCFVLLNVFFGIIATFWLRTGYRQSELALRMALGSNRRTILKLLFTEGLCLIGITIIPVTIIALNIVYMDFTDTFRLPFTIWRLLAGMGITYLLLFVLIILGIWYPARRASHIQPAEILHYE